MISRRVFLSCICLVVISSGALLHRFRYSLILRGASVGFHDYVGEEEGVTQGNTDSQHELRGGTPSNSSKNLQDAAIIDGQPVPSSPSLAAKGTKNGNSSITSDNNNNNSNNNNNNEKNNVNKNSSIGSSSKSNNNNNNNNNNTSPENSLTPSRPVVTNVKDSKILLLSYQRSGSSVVSSLIGQNPEAFFVFEPLDGLYSALYGTSPGWNVPADIALETDGSLRPMPRMESEAVSDFMESIFSCDFDRLPTEFFIHPFWWYFKGWTSQERPYVSCMVTRGFKDRSLGSIQGNLRSTCGTRLLDSRSRRGQCLGKLWPKVSAQRRNQSSSLGDTFRKTSQPMQRYVSSLSQARKKVDFCIKKYLEEPCRKSSIRSMKTVRANMDTARTLLEHYPDLKVIHLLRDPRGATRSRIAATWSHSFYEGNKKERTATAYCTQILADVKAYKALKEQYPNRVTRVVLEDLLESPEERANELFDFLQLLFSDGELKDFMKTVKKGFTEKWKSQFTPQFIAHVNRTCAGYLQEIGR